MEREPARRSPGAVVPESRRSLWMALSTLYLGGEPSEEDLDWVAARCAASPYSFGEIDRIMFDEVYPVLVGNLRSPARERAGFDARWLSETIIARGARRGLPWWASPGKQLRLGRLWREVRRRARARRRLQSARA